MRFKDTRSKKTKDEQFLDKVEELEENFKNNAAGPYYTNREQRRRMMKIMRDLTTKEIHVRVGQERKKKEKGS